MEGIPFEYNGVQGVEIKVPGIAVSGQQQNLWNFPDLPYLRPDRARIKGIQVFTYDSVNYSSVSGTQLFDIGIYQRTSLTLYGAVNYTDKMGNYKRSEGTELIKQIPLISTNNMQNAAADPYQRYILKLESLSVDWEKSNIVITNSPPGNTADRCFLFNVFYDIISTIN